MTVLLRDFRESDHDCIWQIRADTELQHLLMANPDPDRIVDVKAWVARRQEQGHLKVISNDTEEPLGFVQIHSQNFKNQHAWLGIALHPDTQGKGLGKKSMQLLHDYARGSLGLRKLMLEVRRDNHPAIKLYDALNYVRVGDFKKHYFDGEHYHDVLVMERMLVE
ncbi:MAG: GNAT family N-acetyltransferase [Sneathiellales bacterium]|nr:GNAT family N-acetyltransferase [Sneathiellales bacterium]